GSLVSGSRGSVGKPPPPPQQRPPSPSAFFSSRNGNDADSKDNSLEAQIRRHIVFTPRASPQEKEEIIKNMVKTGRERMEKGDQLDKIMVGYALFLLNPENSLDGVIKEPTAERFLIQAAQPNKLTELSEVRARAFSELVILYIMQ